MEVIRIASDEAGVSLDSVADRIRLLEKGIDLAQGERTLDKADEIAVRIFAALKAAEVTAEVRAGIREIGLGMSFAGLEDGKRVKRDILARYGLRPEPATPIPEPRLVDPDDQSGGGIRQMRPGGDACDAEGQGPGWDLNL